MMKRGKQHHSGKPVYNNPHADRFAGPQQKHSNGYSRIAFVMQGGGALGAYQFGVLKGLLEAGYEPDWIAATSIGSIQAAILVGNKAEDRIAKLAEFWDRISTYSLFDCLSYDQLTTDVYNKMSTNSSLSFGQPDFFYPRWLSPYLQMMDTPDKLSFYDISPLRETLLELIDFDLLNASMTKLSLGAVQIDTGQLIYFNNNHYLISPEHIMASAALPPGFPAVVIDDHYYWDGGLHSNSPIEVILGARPAIDTLCFVIDCFGGVPFVPANMHGVEERSKDISYSTHARHVIKRYVHSQQLQNKLQDLGKRLSPEHQIELDHMLQEELPCHLTLAHICYSSRIHRSAAKDYDFSQVTIKKRIFIGSRDVEMVLAESEKWNKPSASEAFRLYEAPNNLISYLRKDD
jgi:NTE family protein